MRRFVRSNRLANRRTDRRFYFPDFIESFGHALEQMREVFLCPDGQPFVVAGSTVAVHVAARLSG